MLHLLWVLLNLGLFLFFLGICFRATKLIRENLGLLASIVFVFGLLSFAGSSGHKNDVTGKINNQVEKWTFASDKEILTGTWNYKLTDIDKTILSTVDLGIAYGREKNSDKLIPIEATSTTSGFVSGHS